MASLSLTAIADDLSERQQTYPITITLNSASNTLNTLAVITTATLMVTIPANGTPTLSITPKQLILNEGQTTQLTIIANTTVTENITITLDDNNQDQINSIPSTITLNQGQTSTVFTITAIDDQLPEKQQAITITLSRVAGLAQIGEDDQTTITIPTNDTPILTITPTQLTLDEGTTAQITIIANTTVTENITITLDDNKQDQIDGIPPSITLSSGQTSTVFTITAIDDNIQERQQAFTISLSKVTGFAQIGDLKQTIITIPTNDIDEDQPFITAILNTKQLTEGDTTTLTIEATQITTATTLSFTTAGPLDRPANNQLITFTPDQTDQTTEITVQASDDNIPSLNQPATITLSSNDKVQLPTTQFTLTVTPDVNDQYQIGFEQTKLTLIEGSTQTVTVIRAIPPALSTPITVTIQINNQNPDQLSLATTQITFSASSMSQVITLTAIDDNKAERQQTYPITITINSQSQVPAVIATPTLTVTIPTNDTPKLTITPKQLSLNEVKPPNSRSQPIRLSLSRSSSP